MSKLNDLEIIRKQLEATEIYQLHKTVTQMIERETVSDNPKSAAEQLKKSKLSEAKILVQRMEQRLSELREKQKPGGPYAEAEFKTKQDALEKAERDLRLAQKQLAELN